MSFGVVSSSCTSLLSRPFEESLFIKEDIWLMSSSIGEDFGLCLIRVYTKKGISVMKYKKIKRYMCLKPSSLWLRKVKDKEYVIEIIVWE